MIPGLLNEILLSLIIAVPLVCSKQWDSAEELQKYPYLKNNQFHQPRTYGSAPSPWIDGPNEERYQFNIGHQSWLAAREHCLSQNADLVSIDSQEELDWILNHYQPHYKHLRERQIQVGLLIDGYDSMREWKWVTGKLLNRTLLPWIHGEPYDHTDGRERCALLGVNMRRLDDIDCDLPASEVRLFRFICERSNYLHLKHEKATNPLMRKLEELLSFFGINPNQNQNSTFSTAAPETEDYWETAFKEDNNKNKTLNKTTEKSVSVSTLSTKNEAAIESVSTPATLDSKLVTSEVPPNKEKPEEEKASTGLQPILNIESEKKQEIKPPETTLPTSTFVETKGDLSNKTEDLEGSTEVVIIPDNAQILSVENGTSKEASPVPPSSPIEVPPSKLVSESPEVQELVTELPKEISSSIESSSTTLEPIETSTILISQEAEKHQMLPIEGPFAAESKVEETNLLPQEKTTVIQQETTELPREETHLLETTIVTEETSTSSLPHEEATSEITETTLIDSTKPGLKPILLETETPNLEKLPMLPNELAIKENLEKLNLVPDVEKDKFTIQPITKLDPLQNLAENMEKMVKNVPPVDLESKMDHLERIVSAVEKMIEPLEPQQNNSNIKPLALDLPTPPEEKVASGMLSALMHGIGLMETPPPKIAQAQEYTPLTRSKPEIGYNHPLNPFRREFRRPMTYPYDDIHTKSKYHGVRTQSNVAPEARLFGRVLNLYSNVISYEIITENPLFVQKTGTNLEESLDEKHKEAIDKEIMINSIEQDFEHYNQTTDNPDLIVSLPNGTLETHCGYPIEESTTEDNKAEKIEKFLISLRKFLDRAPTKDLKKLIDDSKSQNKPIIQKLDEAVNLAMQREIKKMEELEKIKNTGVDINKIEKKMQDISAEAEELRNSIELNVTDAFRKSEELKKGLSEKEIIRDDEKTQTVIDESQKDSGAKNAGEEGYEYKVVIDFKNYTKNQQSSKTDDVEKPEKANDTVSENARTIELQEKFFDSTEKPFVNERTTGSTRKLEETTETIKAIDSQRIEVTPLDLPEVGGGAFLPIPVENATSDSQRIEVTPPEPVKLPEIGSGASVQPDPVENSTLQDPVTIPISKITIEAIIKRPQVGDTPKSKDSNETTSTAAEISSTTVLAKELTSTEHEIQENLPKPVEEVSLPTLEERTTPVEEKTSLEPILLDSPKNDTSNIESTTVAEEIHETQAPQQESTYIESERTQETTSSGILEASQAPQKVLSSTADQKNSNTEENPPTTKLPENLITSSEQPLPTSSESPQNGTQVPGMSPIFIDSVHITPNDTKKLELDPINSTFVHPKMTKLLEEIPFVKNSVIIEELPMNISDSNITKQEETPAPESRAVKLNNEMKQVSSEEASEYSPVKILPPLIEEQNPTDVFPKPDLSLLTPKKLEELEKEQKEVEERNKIEAEKVNQAYDEFNRHSNLENLINKVKQSEHDARKPLGDEAPSFKEKEDTLMEMKKIFDDIGKNFQKLLEGSLQ
uniref:C-type lectin domain-containing protein n=1 Tax=Acrobeloides nanus TaxID=290746 RepID=A0A914C213_9BILA